MDIKALIIKNGNQIQIPVEVGVTGFTSHLTIDTALQQSQWSWSDVMVGFKEIGHDPTQNEKDRIMKNLFIKKLKGLLRKEGVL